MIVSCRSFGAGKTTSPLLARQLKWTFYEADDFHSQANIDKMRTGVALTDEDRQPWLQRLREQIERCLAAGENAVFACSALKKSYRLALRVNGDQVKFVYLRGSADLIAKQLSQRQGHFMTPDLLQSQFDTLEEPDPAEGIVVIEIGRPPEKLAEEIRESCGWLSRIMEARARRTARCPCRHRVALPSPNFSY